MAKVIVVDASRCYACLACVVECSYRRAGASPDDAPNVENMSQSACHVEAVGTEPVPLVCNHCEDAPCAMACPTGAMHRVGDDGPVVLDADRCIGCKACVIACPFGMARLRHDGKAIIKCDLCYDRISKDLPPKCVEACPSGALELRELDDVVAESRRRAAAALLAGGR